MSRERAKLSQFKIIRSADFEKRVVVFECGSLSTRLSSTKTTVDMETSVVGKRSNCRIPRKSCLGMAALLRAVADDLEQMQ